MNDKIYKSLSKASQDIMRGKIKSFAMIYSADDGEFTTIYDKDTNTSALELIGGLDYLKSRVMVGYFKDEDTNDE